MTYNGKVYIYTAIAFIVVAIFISFRCGDEPRVLQSTTSERSFNRALPPAPPLIMHGAIRRTKITIPRLVVDSQLIKRLLADRDSLTKLLNKDKISITFSADTIHPITHDTLRIECDELNRHINYSLTYAPRTEKITIQTQTYFKEVTLWEKIFYAVCGFGLAELIHIIRN